MTQLPASQPSNSPPWNRTTKVLVVVVSLLFLGAFAWRFQSLLAQVIVAAMLAYLVHPIITYIDGKTPFMKRPTVVLIAYLTILVLLLGAIVALGVAAVTQGTALVEAAPALIENAFALLETWSTMPIVVGPFTIDISAIAGAIDGDTIRDQLLGLIEPILSRGGTLIANAASSTLSLLGIGFFIFVVSIYMAIEIPRVGEYVGSIATLPGYREDAERLTREFGRIWSSYLRGQILLGIIIGLIVGITLGLMGVRNSLALGILAGVLEFIPVIGPVVSTVAALLVAFFQPENYLGLTSIQYAGVVLLAMVIIQQLENNLLVPRIVGDALDLHPLFVMVSVFIGASAAGVLGAILAAPIAATLKLIGIYGWHKLFDEEPFPEPERGPDPSIAATISAGGRALVKRFGSRPAELKADRKEDSEPAASNGPPLNSSELEDIDR